MKASFSKPEPARVAIGLNAVIAAIAEERPKVLCVKGPDRLLGLPYGPFDPVLHRTFESGLREWVEKQTQLGLGYVEQLYTFGDKGREAPAAALAGADASDRVVSVGYLALAPEPAAIDAADAGWRDWYEFFPWEDWRSGEPAVLASAIIPALTVWAAAGEESLRRLRGTRLRLAFGLDTGWEEERALDRYELMYEAGLVEEAARDRPKGGRSIAPLEGTGVGMISDHRRILATAIGRLRGKLKYRPVVFELMPSEFTLLALQRTVEAIVGFPLHKQNFRRGVEQSGIVVRTRETARETGGRPAALFRVKRTALRDRVGKGLVIPRLKRSPGAPGDQEQAAGEG